MGKRLEYKFSFEYFESLKKVVSYLGLTLQYTSLQSGLCQQYTSNLQKGTQVPNFQALYSIANTLNEEREGISFMELREECGEDNIIIDLMEMADCRKDRGV